MCVHAASFFRVDGPLCKKCTSNNVCRVSNLPTSVCKLPALAALFFLCSFFLTLCVNFSVCFSAILINTAVHKQHFADALHARVVGSTRQTASTPLIDSVFGRIVLSFVSQFVRSVCTNRSFVFHIWFSPPLPFRQTCKRVYYPIRQGGYVPRCSYTKTNNHIC
jgi:hypothetical protein